MGKIEFTSSCVCMYMFMCMSLYGWGQERKAKNLSGQKSQKAEKL